MERGDHHLAIGALDGEEPVLQVAGVVVLVHADAVGVDPVQPEIAVSRQVVRVSVDDIISDVLAVRGLGQARSVEGPHVSAVEHERTEGVAVGEDFLTQETVTQVAGSQTLGYGAAADGRPEVGVAVDERGPVAAGDAHSAGIAGIDSRVDEVGGQGQKMDRAGGVVLKDLEGLGHPAHGRPDQPAGEVQPVILARSGDVGRVLILVEKGRGPAVGRAGHLLIAGKRRRDGDIRPADQVVDRRDQAAGLSGRVAAWVSPAEDRVVAVHVTEQAVPPEGRDRVVGVVDELRQGEVHQGLGLGASDPLAEVPAGDQRLPGERGERDADQGHQAEHAKHDDEDDPPASGPGLARAGEHGGSSSTRVWSGRPAPFGG